MKSFTRSVFTLLLAATQFVMRAEPPAPAAPDASGPIKLGSLTFTGSLRSRVYFWDWFQPTAGNNNYQYSGNTFRIGLSQNRDTWDWNAEFDTGVDFRVNRRLTLSGYVGYTQGLAAMEQIYPKGKDGKFGYLELFQRF